MSVNVCDLCLTCLFDVSTTLDSLLEILKYFVQICFSALRK